MSRLSAEERRLIALMVPRIGVGGVAAGLRRGERTVGRAWAEARRAQDGTSLMELRLACEAAYEALRTAEGLAVEPAIEALREAHARYAAGIDDRVVA